MGTRCNFVMAEFIVKTISCTSKITAIIELNIDSLDCEYKNLGLSYEQLDFKKKIHIDSGKGSNFDAEIHIASISSSTLMFAIRVQNMCKHQMDLVLNERISKSLTGTNRGLHWAFDIVKNLEKLRSVKGFITVEFEPSPQMILKEKFKNYITSCLVFKPDGKGEDFTIACQGKEFGFNKSILCNVSPAFEAMLTNPCLKENQEGRVDLTDTTPKTIQGLKNILMEDYIKE